MSELREAIEDYRQWLRAESIEYAESARRCAPLVGGDGTARHQRGISAGLDLAAKRLADLLAAAGEKEANGE